MHTIEICVLSLAQALPYNFYRRLCPETMADLESGQLQYDGTKTANYPHYTTNDTTFDVRLVY